MPASICFFDQHNHACVDDVQLPSASCCEGRLRSSTFLATLCGDIANSICTLDDRDNALFNPMSASAISTTALALTKYYCVLPVAVEGRLRSSTFLATFCEDIANSTALGRQINARFDLLLRSAQPRLR